MQEDKNKEEIILPRELQIKMMQFFLRTSIPTIKKEKENRLSTKDRSDT